VHGWHKMRMEWRYTMKVYLVCVDNMALQVIYICVSSYLVKFNHFRVH